MTGVGATGAANDIDIAATTIVASDSGTGGIFLTETDDLAIGTTHQQQVPFPYLPEERSPLLVILLLLEVLNITGVDVTNTNTITGDSMD